MEPMPPKEPQPVMQLHELAEFFGVVKRTVWRYTLRADFPRPYATLSTGKAWKTSDVVRWQKKHNPPFPVGRPKSKKKR
jgi:prophage regulatory protein